MAGMTTTTKLRIKLFGNLLVALFFVWLLTHPGRPSDLVYTIESTAFVTIIIAVCGRNAVRAASQMRLYSKN